MTLVGAIKNRHSVRKYKNVKIEKEKVAVLEKLIEEANKESGLNLQFIEDAGKSFGRILSRVMGLSSAPSVIACVGRDETDLDEKVGYFGEKIVLEAQRMGLNTCWAGTYNKEGVPAKIEKGERLAIVIAIGYGENEGKAHKSRTLAEVSNVSANSPIWFKYGVEMAMLAPTAINQQKFYIKLNSDGTVSFTDKLGVLSKIDLGIVKYHFEVGKNGWK